MDPATIRGWGLFIGNQENVALRFGGAVGILFNLLMVVIAIIAIMVTVPNERPAPSGPRSRRHSRSEARKPPLAAGVLLRRIT
jgi:DHA2 family multidrug resistance protein-like MFS transporter